MLFDPAATDLITVKKASLIADRVLRTGPVGVRLAAACLAAAVMMTMVGAPAPASAQKAVQPASPQASASPAVLSNTASASAAAAGTTAPASSTAAAQPAGGADPQIAAQRHFLPLADDVHTDAHGKTSSPVYHLLGFSLRGTTRVNTDAIVAALPQHEGDIITNAEINENLAKVGQILKASHIHGDMTTAILEREGPGHHIWVMWDVHGADALSNAPFHGKRHLESQTFTGNVKLTTDALIAATGLHPGDALPDGRLGDARTGIEQAYDKALPGAGVQVKGKIKLKPDNTVLVNWQITEPK